MWPNRYANERDRLRPDDYGDSALHLKWQKVENLKAVKAERQSMRRHRNFGASCSSFCIAASPISLAWPHPPQPPSRTDVLTVLPQAGRTAMIGVEIAAVKSMDVAVRTHRDRAIPRDGPTSEVAGAAGSV
jgi:hypothetical protein